MAIEIGYETTVTQPFISMSQTELTTNAAAQEIQEKYDEFRRSCKTILPKIDPKIFFIVNRRFRTPNPVIALKL